MLKNRESPSAFYTTDRTNIWQVKFACICTNIMLFHGVDLDKYVRCFCCSASIIVKYYLI